jgi:hypothetical protein
LWHWLDKRLQSEQQVQEQTDKRFNYLSIYRVKDQRFVRLADDEVREVSAGARSKWAAGYDSREYERMGRMDGRNYRDVYAINLDTGARKLAVRKARFFNGASPDASRFAYYDDGASTYTIARQAGHQHHLAVLTSFVNADNDTNVNAANELWVGRQQRRVDPDGWDVAGAGHRRSGVN